MTSREYLYGLELHGIKLGLDNISRLLEPAGEPQHRYPTIHIAGTNGKGSVAAMVDAMLQAAGYSTGRFTSPHLIELSERFLHNSTPITADELDAGVAFFRPIAQGMAPPPTFFEFVTAIAFRWFGQKDVDVGVIEVGMGGRFDSTNVVLPEVCAITNIDLEHTKYLGDTLEKIAFEKAGIIKPKIPVVVSESNRSPRDVILERARVLNSPVRLAGRDFTYGVSGPPFAQHFRYESATLRLGPTAFGLSGLRDARWPCRLERVLDRPPVIIDVAHNAAGARKLAQELPPCVVILAVSSDKDAAAMAGAFASVARHLILSEFSGRRALPAHDLSSALRGFAHQVISPLSDAIEAGLALANESLPLVITGSIFTAGEARSLLIQSKGAAPLRF
ncbi:MAG: bifunctional folylpolyglutamate synthase/dihydrofolate synthase [Candidatus Hydrogenedentes bacterium]|nr:bifunctional folylpolyglutamate synthase/dihydrofolate synthase [Candidatus Hydrogenedentota bacterium]